MEDPTGISTGWRLAREDCKSWHGISSAEEAFTKIYIRYQDPQTGEEGVVHAEKRVEGYPLMETIVPKQPPGAPLTKSEAQELADQAAAVLGGVPIQRYWARIDATRLLERQGGDRQPASAMQPRDSVSADFLRGEIFYVFGVTPESDGTVLVSLADVDLAERLDVEIMLFSLEHT